MTYKIYNLEWLVKENLNKILDFNELIVGSAISHINYHLIEISSS